MHASNHKSTVRLGSQREIIVGVATGLALATLLSGFAALVYATDRSSLPQQTKLSLAQVVFCYYLGSGLGGFIFGLLSPMLDTTVGSAAIGFLAFLPFFAATSLTIMGVSGWFPAGLVISVILSAVIGAGVTSIDKRR
jgi:hypothetical protein